ncbi:hypothetical protein V1504DRAFT_437887 [Lipomyces starkeyi]
MQRKEFDRRITGYVVRSVIGNNRINASIRFGRLVRCDIPAPRNPSSRAFAFVEYEDRRDAEDAYYDLHHRRIRSGDILNIEWARNSPSSSWRYDERPRRRRTSPSPPPRRGRDYSRSPVSKHARSLSPRDRRDRDGGENGDTGRLDERDAREDERDRSRERERSPYPSNGSKNDERSGKERSYDDQDGDVVED